MDTTVGTLIVAAVILAAIVAIAWGWSRRKQAQSEVVSPPKPQIGRAHV